MNLCYSVWLSWMWQSRILCHQGREDALLLPFQYGREFQTNSNQNSYNEPNDLRYIGVSGLPPYYKGHKWSTLFVSMRSHQSKEKHKRKRVLNILKQSLQNLLFKQFSQPELPEVYMRNSGRKQKKNSPVIFFGSSGYIITWLFWLEQIIFITLMWNEIGRYRWQNKVLDQKEGSRGFLHCVKLDVLDWSHIKVIQC